jgi:subtilase family serine protease
MGARHCPGAKIILVEAKSSSNADLYAAVDLAVANGATVVSMSWSGGELPNETTADSHFEVTGVTFVAASGDSGHGVVPIRRPPHSWSAWAVPP